MGYVANDLINDRFSVIQNAEAHDFSEMGYMSLSQNYAFKRAVTRVVNSCSFDGSVYMWDEQNGDVDVSVSC
jgi:hypothetical protein